MSDDHQLQPFSAGSEIRRHWRLYLAASGLAVALTMVITLSIPKVYAARITLADESKEIDLLMGQNQMQAWLKGTIKQNMGYKNIEVYALHVTSRAFAQELGHVKLSNLGTDYEHYLREHYRRPWWEHLFTTDNEVDIVGVIEDNIKVEVNSYYSTLRIQTTDQDPVVAALLCDSVRAALEHFVIGEQQKMTLQLQQNYAILRNQAEQRYRDAQQRYVQYADSHNDSRLASETNEEKALQNEYDKAYKQYNEATLQYLRAEALVNKPAPPFAIVNNATVLTEVHSPRFMAYLLSFLCFALIGTTWFVLLRKKYELWKGGSAI
ncbi:MAG: hypothetical protein IKT00_08800 [Prevotella sp.]|nr:hypothetical protein [Prevotella sp.]